MDDSSGTQPNVSSQMTTPTLLFPQPEPEVRKWPPATFDRNQSIFPPHVEEHDYHTNAHAQAIAYIVIILVLYFSALTVTIVRYLRKERNQFHLPRYLLKKDRSPPSPSSFRLNSGRRHNNHATAAAAADLNTVSNLMDTPPTKDHALPNKDQHSSPNKDQHSPLNNQMQINTTAV